MVQYLEEANKIKRIKRLSGLQLQGLFINYKDCLLMKELKPSRIKNERRLKPRNQSFFINNPCSYLI